MPDAALARARLVAQGLVTRPFTDPQSAVDAFLAMQGQDLAGVLSSIALRTSDGDLTPVLASLDAGDIVRGYPMRGTVFAVAATDLAWLTELCAAPALRAAERRRHQLELDTDKVERAREVALARLADEPRGLSRADLFDAWQQAGQPTDKGRGYHILAFLIGAGAVCYGPWNGTDQNVVATSAWLPPGSGLDGRFNGDRHAAVAEALRRYLVSHGPATLHDFAWWTKLPLRDIRAGFALIGDTVEASPGRPGYYQRPGLDDELVAADKSTARPMLLPGFDEFILGYADRLFAMTEAQHDQLVPGNNGVFQRSVVIDGAVRGFWKLGGRPGKRAIVLEEFGRGLSKAHRTAVERLFAAFPLVAG